MEVIPNKGDPESGGRPFVQWSEMLLITTSRPAMI